MIIPTEEEMKMYAKFAPLEEWRKRASGTELRDDAPEDMKLLALEEQEWREKLRKQRENDPLYRMLNSYYNKSIFKGYSQKGCVLFLLQQNGPGQVNKLPTLMWSISTKKYIRCWNQHKIGGIKNGMDYIY